MPETLRRVSISSLPVQQAVPTAGEIEDRQVEDQQRIVNTVTAPEDS